MNTEKNRLPVRSGKKNDFKEKSRRNIGMGSDADEGLSLGKMVKNSVISVVIGMIVSIALLIVFALVSYSNPDPDKLVFPLALIALYVGAVVAGIITAKRNGEKILFGGLITGLVYLLMIFMLSLIPEELEFVSKISGLYSVIAHAALIFAAIAGSFFGRKKEAKKPSMKHRIPKN